jgi:O-methyltransferase involved in polyketide biosynthesis
MTTKTSVKLGNVQKTLFLPMWGRAVESRKEKPLLFDQAALTIMDEIDYDFRTIAENISELTQMAWIMRSVHVDEVVKAFLTKFPGGTIVNIGCGMDTTFDRIDNGSLLWYDLDLPDVIELRRQFIHETERRKFIPCSFLDEGWLREIRVDQNVLFIVAGVFYYFEERDVRDFLTRLADLFPGSEVIFDVSSPYGVRVANKLVITKSGLDEKSFLKWGLDNTQTLLTWDKRFQLLHTYYYFRANAGALTLKNKLLGMFSDFLQIQYMVYLRLK